MRFLGLVPPAIILAILWLIGFGLLGFGLWSTVRSNRAASWPLAEGKLDKLSLEEKVKPPDRRSNQETIIYRVKVEYTYTVAGRVYHGSRLAFGYGGSNIKQPHEAIITKLKNANVVMVRYDPLDPSSSTLSCGVHQTAWSVLLFAVTWLVFMLGMTTVFWYSIRTKPKNVTTDTVCDEPITIRSVVAFTFWILAFCLGLYLTTWVSLQGDPTLLENLIVR